MTLYALNNLSDPFQQWRHVRLCRQETEAMVEQIGSHTSFYVNLSEAPTVNYCLNSLQKLELYALFEKLTT